MWFSEDLLIQYFRDSEIKKNTFRSILFVNARDESIKKIFKLINCPQNLICGENCRFCREWNFSSVADVFRIEPQKKDIQREQIEFLKNWLFFVADKNKNNFFWIKDAHRLTKSATSLLLKFLEDAPVSFFGFFSTRYPEKISPVLKSRLQIFKIKQKEGSLLLDAPFNEQNLKILKRLKEDNQGWDENLLEKNFFSLKKESELLLSYWLEKRDFGEFLEEASDEVIFDNILLFIKFFFEEARLVFFEYESFSNIQRKKHKTDREGLYNLLKKISIFFQKIDEKNFFEMNLPLSEIDFLFFLKEIFA